jgi:hypothetical protein
MGKMSGAGVDMQIYCCQCAEEVDARLTTGAEIYPHRSDLAGVPFWRCDGCKNYVGCHHKKTGGTRPVGNIASPLVRTVRKQIHALLDPLWRDGRRSRGEVYRLISGRLGYQYHTGEIKSWADGQKVLAILLESEWRDDEIRTK